MHIIECIWSITMNLTNNKKIKNTEIINCFSNLNNYLIQIEYYDKKGIKKIKNNIPLKNILNKKQVCI